jgi:hypothetical protein
MQSFGSRTTRGQLEDIGIDRIIKLVLEKQKGKMGT